MSLYSSIYGQTDQGIFDDLYSRYGASPPVKRMDIRLGQVDEDEEEDEEEEEITAVSAVAPVQPARVGPPPKSIFAQNIGGFPVWLLGVAFLGFAWAYRRKKKKSS